MHTARETSASGPYAAYPQRDIPKGGIPSFTCYGRGIEIQDWDLQKVHRTYQLRRLLGGPARNIHKKQDDGRGSGVAKHNSGKILASFREIPVVSINEAEILGKKLSGKGLGDLVLFGKPNQPLLDIPVGVDKVGMIVVGGLNPVAAVEESGIPTETMAMSTLFDYSKLLGFNEAVSSFLFQ